MSQPLNLIFPTFKNIYLFHVIPVCYNAVFDGIFESQNTSLALSFVADVRVFLTHTNHHTLMPWTANDGGKHCTRSIVSGETGLAHTGAIVYNQSGNVIVSHIEKKICTLQALTMLLFYLDLTNRCWQLSFMQVG